MATKINVFKTGEEFYLKEKWRNTTLGKKYKVLGMIDDTIFFINDKCEQDHIYFKHAKRCEESVTNDTKNNGGETEMSEFEVYLYPIVNNITKMLIEKNRKYGNAALKPQRIFSKASAVEQIKVRIDDKLSRMKNQQNDEDEDVISDLIGYLILLKIAKEGI